MIDCVIMVQTHDCLNIVVVKSIYPFTYYFFWS